jgi:hypothetical protein
MQVAEKLDWKGLNIKLKICPVGTNLFDTDKYYGAKSGFSEFCERA